MTNCAKCGQAITTEAFCPACGTSTAAPAPTGATPPPPPPPTPQPGQPIGMASAAPVPSLADASGKKLAAGICGILLGAFGVHKFILGYTKEGLIMLLLTVFTCGIAGIVFGIIGLVEGILYLTKSDNEFYDTYMVNKRGWF